MPIKVLPVCDAQMPQHKQRYRVTLMERLGPRSKHWHAIAAFEMHSGGSIARAAAHFKEHGFEPIIKFPQGGNARKLDWVTI